MCFVFSKVHDLLYPFGFPIENKRKKTDREMFLNLAPEHLGIIRGIIFWGLFKFMLLHRSLQPRCQLTLNVTVALWCGQLATQIYTRTTCSYNIGHQTGTRWWQHLIVISTVTFTSTLFKLDISRTSYKICIWCLIQYGFL